MKHVKQTKRILSCISIAALVASLTACSGSSQSAATDHAGETLTGRVVAVDGTYVALELGEVSDSADGSDAANDAASEDGAKSGDSSDSSSDSSSDDATSGDSTQSDDSSEGSSDDAASEDSTQSDDSSESSSDSAASGDNGAGGAANGETPPEKPDGDASGSSTDGQTPPEMPSGGQPGSGDAQTPGGDMSGGNMAGGFTASGETAIVNIDGASVTIQATSDDEEDSEGSSDDVAVGAVVTVEIDSSNSASSVTVISSAPESKEGDDSSGESGEAAQGTAANTIDSDTDYSGTSYSSDGDDENALRVDGATTSLSKITVEKSGGASSSTEDGDFYGMNAALLATNGANVTISDATVTSDAQNGNGVFSYGDGTVVTISDSSITTSADNSGGIQTTGGGTTNADNLTVKTSGSSSAAIRSDRGGGTVNVTGGTYTSDGYNSPAVYSTAAITVSDAVLTANNSEALVIEGENSIAINDCTVSGNMSDDKGSSSSENVHNVMIYQSMSGDAEEGTSSFSMEGGSLTSNNGDMFYITNTACTLSLTDASIKNKDADGLLMNITGNSGEKGWGEAGSNGAQVTCTLSKQTLSGDISVDSISTLDLTLSDSSDFTGTINITDNAQGGDAVSDNAVVTVEKGSTWTLTGDCTITSLTNNGTVDYNGYTITLADGTTLSE